MAKEIELQKQIRDAINSMGGFCWRNNTGSFSLEDKRGKQRYFKAGIKGSSDIIGTWKDGRSLAIEVKVGKNKPSDDQLRFLEEVTRRGGIGFVAYSLDEVIKNLENA
jgi:hypothetical protein